jgi:hypothetical protein
VENWTLSLEMLVETEGERTKRAEDERNGGQTGKRGHEAPLGEACLSEEREPMSVTNRRWSSRCQTERGGKVFWDAEQSDRHLPRC